MALPALIPALLPLLGGVLDKVIPDPEAREKAKAEMARMQMEGRFKEQEIQMSAIVMEAQSDDKWTSRARPSFMYVIYAFILFSMPMGGLYIIDPVLADAYIAGVQKWLQALPGELYALFGAGYLGYGAMRSRDKGKMIDTLRQMGRT